SPDSQSILFLGQPDSSRNLLEAIDWWLAPIGSGELKKTGACANFISNGLVPSYKQCAVPGDWDGTHVYFAVPSADGENIWRADLAAGRREFIEKPLRITSGKNFEIQPSTAAGGRLVFARQMLNVDIWSVPAALSEGRVSGGLKRITNNPGFDTYPSVSASSGKLAFLSNCRGT